MSRRAPYLVGLLFASSPAAASAPDFKVELACRPEAAPGRVLCELEFFAGAGTRLTWADALVTASPDFARPLRARLPPERFAPAGTTPHKLSLAFVATKPGVGQVTVRARAVVCQGQGARERCRPRTEEVVGEIRVGSS